MKAVPGPKVRTVRFSYFPPWKIAPGRVSGLESRARAKVLEVGLLDFPPFWEIAGYGWPGLFAKQVYP